MTRVYEEQFSPGHDFPRRDEPTTYYVIASTPRCGSHLLGHTLFQTGALGFPLEYFNPVNFPRWSKRFGTTGLIDTYAAIRMHRTSPNGCFGTKLHFSHFRWLTNKHRFEDLFPDARVVYLEREDLLGQAVSLAKARQTQSWIATQPVQAAPKYDAAAIDRAMRDIVMANASWRLTLGRHQWPTLRVTYEEFLLDPDRVILRIADFLDVDPGEEGQQAVQLPESQSDTTNQTWKTRYLAEPRTDAVVRFRFDPGDEGESDSERRTAQSLRRMKSFVLGLRQRLFDRITG